MGTLMLRRFFSILVAAVVLAMPLQSVQSAPEVPYVAKDPTDLPSPIGNRGPTTVTVDLYAEEVVTEIEPGKRAWVWTFNGTIPGPMIRVREGDTVVINLTNNIGNEEPHNIDLHAAREFYVGQDDWYHDALGNADHGIPDDVNVLDEDKALAEQPSLYTFNGHKHALTDPNLFGETIRAEQGDKVRFFFVTGGPNIGSNWHIIGTIFDKVCTGHVKDATRNEETVYVPPGSAAVFELDTPVPGQYLLVEHALWRVAKGAGGFMWVDQTEEWPDDMYYPNPADL